DPKIVRVRHLVLGAGLGSLSNGLIEAAELQEPPQRRLAHACPVGEDPVLMEDLMEELDGELAVLDAVAGDRLGDIVVDLAERSLIRARLGVEGVETSSLVLLQPEPQARGAESAQGA